jgi:hypothetical protein
VKKFILKDFDYYVSNEIPKNGYYYDSNINQIKKVLSVVIKNNDSFDERIYYDEYCCTKIEYAKNIIATTKSSLEIPKVVDEVEEMDRKEFYNDTLEGGNLTVVFIQGYKKAKLEFKWTDKDMLYFLIYFQRTAELGFYSTGENVGKTQKEVLELWQSQKTIKIYFR